MVRKELLQLRQLKMTPKMSAVVQADVPKKTLPIVMAGRPNTSCGEPTDCSCATALRTIF